jgi:DNA polymerase
MPRHLHIDLETFSEVDIRDVGAYRYANDPSTEILCAAMAFDEEEPVAWDCTMADEWETDHLKPYFDSLCDTSVLVYAHNSMFEAAICQALLQKTWGIPCPDLSRFRCTMSLARRAALPGKLETLAEVLDLPHKKDNRGKALIKKFSVMQPAKKPTKAHPNGLPPRRIRPQDEPEAFREFVEYCRQDVRVEQMVSKRLAYFSDDLNNKNYSLDAKINARGVPVNLKALRHAQKLIEEETEIVSRQFRELTGFEVTQNAVLLKWLKERGYSGDDLQAETIESFLDSYSDVTIPDEDDTKLAFVIRALRLKQSIAYASIKKVKTMLDCAGPHDNRIRGTLNHHGATTGRWTASLTQMQNMKRPTIKQSEAAYGEICNGISRDMLELCYGPVLEVISSCVRHFVQDVREEI